MILDHRKIQILKELKKLSYPSTIESKIRQRLKTIEISKEKEKEVKHVHHSYMRFQYVYPENIKHLEKIRQKQGIKEPQNYQVNISVVLPETEKEIRDIASKASIYFLQGYEMYKTSLEMDINSSPIIEYYALLQIVKGVIMLELKVEPEEFFSAHGLKRKKKDVSPDVVHQAKIQTHGVFAALLIRCTDYLEKDDGTKNFTMDEYYDNYFPSLKEMIDQKDNRGILNVFIFSWMLSEVARYKPEEWKKICEGIDNKWIVNIDDFRDFWLPDAIIELLDQI